MTGSIQKSYQQIPVSELLVDPNLDAQRIFQPQWATKLTKMYDRDLLLPALVSQRIDGRYYLLDGQHSTAVALDLEGPDFLRDCMVYKQLSLEMEARLFLAANRDRKPVKPFDNFKVALTAHDPLAIQVDAEVKSLQLEIGSGTSTNRVGAVQALMAIGAKREGLVARTLQVAEAAWGREPATWDNMMLRAIGMVLHANWDHAGLDTKRLASTLERQSVSRWKSNALSTGNGGVGGSSSRSTPLAGHIITAYNGRLSQAKMISLAAA